MEAVALPKLPMLVTETETRKTNASNPTLGDRISNNSPHFPNATLTDSANLQTAPFPYRGFPGCVARHVAMRIISAKPRISLWFACGLVVGSTMQEILDFLGTKVSIPALWMIAGALLLVAAGGRSAWPAIGAAVLVAGYYFLEFAGVK